MSEALAPIGVLFVMLAIVFTIDHFVSRHNKRKRQ